MTIMTSWNIQHIPDDAPDLRKYGFAPGWYSFWCHTCKDQHVAAKRSSNCYECAMEMYKTDNMRKEFEERFEQNVNVAQIYNTLDYVTVKDMVKALDTEVNEALSNNNEELAIGKFIALRSLISVLKQAEKYMTIQRLCNEDEVSKC